MPEDSSPVPLRQIADIVGVSVSSVSRALSGRGDLAQATRERILEVAEQLSYDKAKATRGRPAAAEPRLIELILGSFDDAWTDEVTAGARRSAFRQGFDLVLTLERDDPDDDWPTRVAARRPVGVILGLIRPTERQLEHLRSLRIPVVLFDPRSEPRGELVSVGTTDWQGGYDAARHFIDTGMRRFAVVTGVPRFRFGKAREDGFRAAIAEHLPDTPVERLDAAWSDAEVQRPLGAFLGGERTPAGIFACNDEMALAVYRAADRLGYSIPRELSVIGFNDEPRAALAVPPLSSVRQPLRAMAARAVELVREQRESGHHRAERVELPTRLILRGSTLPAR